MTHPNTGRNQARRRYPDLGTCEGCGARPAVDRHHVNGDVFDQRRENVRFLCNRCHQEADGRMERNRAADVRPMIEAAAALKRAQTTCKLGHPLSVITADGRRGCRVCREAARQRYLARQRRARAERGR